MHHIMVFPLGSELIKSGGKSQAYCQNGVLSFISPVSSLWVCYMSWVSSDFWQPYSDVHGALSSEPYLVPANSCKWLLLWSQSISILAFLFSYCLPCFPALLSFPENPAFSYCAWSRTASVLFFCFQWYFRLNLLLDSLVCLSDSPQHLYNSLPIPNWKWIHFFLSSFFTVQLLYSYIVIGNMRYGWS